MPQTAIPLPDFAPSHASDATNYDTLERSELEQRLARAEERIDELRRPEDTYKLTERSLETEARVKPFLDKVFAQYDVKEPKYTFECHDRVCRINSDVKDEWTLPLQETYPEKAIFRTMSFGSPDGTFIELHRPDVIPTFFLQGLAVAALLPAQKACELTKSPQGTIIIVLAYDAARRAITYTLAGSLVAEPVGVCVRKILDEQIAKVSVPPEMSRSINTPPFTLTLPIPEQDR